MLATCPSHPDAIMMAVRDALDVTSLLGRALWADVCRCAERTPRTTALRALGGILFLCILLTTYRTRSVARPGPETTDTIVNTCSDLIMANDCALLADKSVCVQLVLPGADGTLVPRRFVLPSSHRQVFWPSHNGTVAVETANGTVLHLRDNVWVTDRADALAPPVHLSGRAALCVGVLHASM